MKALLVHRDGTLGFEDVSEGLHILLRKVIRMPVRAMDDPDECPFIPVLTFIHRGKAGPYQVFEENT